MSRDFSLDWSTAVTVGTILFAFGGFYWTTRVDMKAIKEELSMLRKAVEQIAVQNVRLDNHGAMIASMQKQQAIHDERLFNLSRGDGYIQRSLDGEWPKA